MTIINANTSSMKVLKACKENGKLGEEIREGGRGGAESQGEGERKTEGRKGRGVGRGRGKRNHMPNVTSSSIYICFVLKTSVALEFLYTGTE